MAIVDIRALFEYNWYCRRKFLESMAKLPWEKVVEDRGASFGSVRNIFLHSLEAEQGWLRHLVHRKEGKWQSRDYEKSFKDIEAMKEYMIEVEAESRAYLAELKKSGQLNKEFSLGKNIRHADARCRGGDTP